MGVGGVEEVGVGGVEVKAELGTVTAGGVGQGLGLAPGPRTVVSVSGKGSFDVYTTTPTAGGR